MKSKRFLITGGAGFIGSHVSDALISLGHSVRILDNLDPQVHGDHEKTSEGWPKYLNPGCECILGDVGDYEIVAKSLIDIDIVIHLAAAVGVGQSMSEIVHYTKTNALATAVLLEAIAKTRPNLSKLLVASSMSIYGEGLYKTQTGKLVAPPMRTIRQLQKHEWELIKNGKELAPIATAETKPLEPSSIYAIGKRDQEEMCLVMGKALGIPTVALRLFNTYGPRQALSNPYTGVAAIFISRLANDQAPIIFEDGQQRRDFVHVSDVAQAFVTVSLSSKKVWKSYNVGSATSVTIAQVAKMLTELMQKTDLTPQILNKYRVGDVRHCFADISAITRDFGFKPQVSFTAGMAELVAWVTQGHTIVDRIEHSLHELSSHNLLL